MKIEINEEELDLIKQISRGEFGKLNLSNKEKKKVQNVSKNILTFIEFKSNPPQYTEHTHFKGSALSFFLLNNSSNPK